VNVLARTGHANALAVIRRSTVFRIALISALMMAIGGRPAVSHAQSNPGPGQKESEQVVQPINFRLPEPLWFDSVLFDRHEPSNLSVSGLQCENHGRGAYHPWKSASLALFAFQ
jgi:hypothetical protein